ncbi:hypothetical protein L873DRAFT_1786435 [Choiromyces venosus 120613-1]|uniref:Uncharacterized protein n=1 Tax=Choiromyces venosus 120613-1 TaxID=1336337 RepID=A0A3N4K4P2_9PEZI|nr:hypothetical protein L873DRAFT_1786435 [Choiromyces venosus 120613-1]
MYLQNLLPFFLLFTFASASVLVPREDVSEARMVGWEEPISITCNKDQKITAEDEKTIANLKGQLSPGFPCATEKPNFIASLLSVFGFKSACKVLRQEGKAAVEFCAEKDKVLTVCENISRAMDGIIARCASENSGGKTMGYATFKGWKARVYMRFD